MSWNKISRINVVGTSASGKSTLAKAVAAKLGCAYVEMDALWFKEDWQNVSDEEFNARVLSGSGCRWWCGLICLSILHCIEP